MARMRSLVSASASVLMIITLIVGLDIRVSPPAWAGANPNQVVSANIAGNGDRFVFWICPNYVAICEAYYNSSSKRWTKMPDLHVGTILSAPSVSLSMNPDDVAGPRDDPYMYVFFAGGAKDDLEEEYWTGRWHGPINLRYGPLEGPPAAPPHWYTDEAVAWMSVTSHLSYAQSDNPTKASSWHGPYTRKVGEIARPPSVTDAGGGSESAWWTGNNGNLYSASLEVTGESPYGPCDFGMGYLDSVPSVVWGPGLISGDGPRTPATRSLISANERTAARVSGNCPKPLYFGSFGSYTVCWAGEGKKDTGLWCMQWYVEGDALNPVIVVAGPFEDGKMGVLGSSPGLAYYPYVYVCNGSITGSITGCQYSDIYAFWQGSNLHEDLMEANATTGSRPVNLGYGPLTGP
jgi:hypothetical protein